MENASKALIIAAAILIALVLITLGVYIIGVGQDQIKNAGTSDFEVTSFNQKFTQYADHQKGSAIRTLVQTVMANNNSQEASDETQIEIDGIVKLAKAANSSPDYGDLKNTKTYNVKITYTNGRVSKITIENITT